MFTSTIRMGKKCDLSDFDHWLIVGARQCHYFKWSVLFLFRFLYIYYFHHLPVSVYYQFLSFPVIASFHALVFPSMSLWLHEPEYSRVFVQSPFGHFRILGIFWKLPSPLLFSNSHCFTHLHSLTLPRHVALSNFCPLLTTSSHN